MIGLQNESDSSHVPTTQRRLIVRAIGNFVYERRSKTKRRFVPRQRVRRRIAGSQISLQVGHPVQAEHIRRFRRAATLHRAKVARAIWKMPAQAWRGPLRSRAALHACASIMCVRVKNDSHGGACPAAFLPCPRAVSGQRFLINTWVTWWWCLWQRLALPDKLFLP